MISSAKEGVDVLWRRRQPGSGSDEVDQSTDDRDVLDHVDDLIRAGNGIANESCVDRDRRKDEERDQRDGNIASPQTE